MHVCYYYVCDVGGLGPPLRRSHLPERTRLLRVRACPEQHTRRGANGFACNYRCCCCVVAVLLLLLLLLLLLCCCCCGLLLLLLW